MPPKNRPKIQCVSGNKGELLCCSQFCQNRPIKCFEDCNRCSGDHKDCFENQGLPNFQSKYEKISTHHNYHTQNINSLQKMIKDIQEPLNKLQQILVSTPYYQWGLPEQYIRILNFDFSRSNGKQIKQFFSNPEPPSVHKKYLIPPIFINESKQLKEKVIKLSSSTSTILNIFRQLASLDLSITNIEHKQSQKPNKTIKTEAFKNIFDTLQQQLEKRQKQISPHYEYSPAQKDIFKQLYLRIMRCILKEIKKQMQKDQQENAWKLTVLCQKIFQRQRIDKQQIQAEILDYKQSKGYLMYCQGRKQNNKIKKNQFFENALQFYCSLQKPTDKQLKIMIQIFHQQQKNEQYIKHLQILEEKQGPNIEEETLVKIRNFYRENKEKKETNDANLKLLNLYQKQPQKCAKKIQQIYPLITKYYSQNNTFARELMFLKQQLNYYLNKEFNSKIFREQMRIRKTIALSYIAQRNFKSAESLTKQTMVKCYKQYKQLEKQLLDKEGGQDKVEVYEKCLITMQYMQWFAIKFLEISKELQLPDNDDTKIAIKNILTQCANQGIKKFGIFYWLSTYEYNHYNRQSANKYLRCALEIYPEPDLYYYLADISYREFQDENTIAALTKCLILNQFHYKARFLRGKCHLNRNQFQVAKNYLQKLQGRAQIPQDTLNRYIGECYEGMHDQKHEKLKSDRNLTQDQIESLQRQKIKNFDLSLQYYEKSLYLNPKNQQAILGKARLLSFDHKFEQAKQILRKALYSFNDNADFYQLLGQTEEAHADAIFEKTLYKDYERLEKAQQLYQRAYEIDNNRSENLQHIKRCLQK